MAENVDPNDVFDYEKVEKAIGDVMDVLKGNGLSIAEAVVVSQAVNSGINGMYPEVYRLMKQIFAQK